jgi:membrane associated rhomboid family serine protease
MFLHAGYAHLTGNAYVLLFAGIPVDLRLGRLRATVIFLLSGLVGGLVEAFATTAPNEHVVGASGGIYGLVGAGAVLSQGFGEKGDARRRAIVSLGMLLVFVGILSAIDYGTHDHVAWRAHLGGLATGLALGIAFRGTKVVRP